MKTMLCFTNNLHLDQAQLQRSESHLELHRVSPRLTNTKLRFPPRPAINAGLPSERSTLMNWDRIEGNWKQLRGKVQQQWGNLTNDDLTTIEGRRVELVGKIQERYGIAKDEAEKQVDNWIRNM